MGPFFVPLLTEQNTFYAAAMPSSVGNNRNLTQQDEHLTFCSYMATNFNALRKWTSI